MGEAFVEWGCVGERTLACWHDAVRCWEWDHHNCQTAEEKAREFEKLVKRKAAKHAAQKRKRNEAAEALQRAHNMKVVSACEENRCAQVKWFAEAAQWEGRNPGEVQRWEQWRPADPTVECCGTRQRSRRVATGKGTCGGTEAWQAALKLRQHRERVDERTCVGRVEDGVQSKTIGECAVSVLCCVLFGCGLMFDSPTEESVCARWIVCWMGGKCALRWRAFRLALG